MVAEVSDLTYSTFWRDRYLDYLGAPTTHKNTKHKHRVRDFSRWRSLAFRTHRQPENTSALPFKQQTSLVGKNVWVWSDLHFGHKNIIQYSERPFVDVIEMRETLIRNHNEVVGIDDISMWVGDVAFLPDNEANQILARCNGYHILIVGNHDLNKGQLKRLNFDEIHVVYTYIDGEVPLVFTHYPITMDNSVYPWINIHGHVHVNKYGAKQQSESDYHINVNCEFHDYKPVALGTIMEWAKSRNIAIEDHKR